MKKNLIKFIPVFLIASVLFNTPALALVDAYTVQQGDSLWKIAVKYQVGLSEIISANSQFKNPDIIYPGNVVYVPLVNEETLSLEEQVVELVNKERAKHQLKPLKMNWEVARVARIKSEDMRDKNYFDHTSPVYGSPFEMLKNFNIKYKTAGENIAKGQKTASDVMRSWMSSEGHKKNILNPSFTEIGVGYASGYWTQIFIG